MKQCTVHNDQYVTLICTYTGQCEQRWACTDCRDEQIHQHGGYQSYLIEKDQFYETLDGISPDEIYEIKNIITQSEKLDNDIQLIIDSVSKLTLYEEIYGQYKKKISELTQEQLDILINIHINQRQYKNIRHNMESLNIQSQSLMRQQEYQFQMVKIDKQEMRIPTISSNERYLGYCQKSNQRVYFKLMTLRSFKNHYQHQMREQEQNLMGVRQNVKEVRLDLISFTNDSKFVTLYDGKRIYCFFLKNKKQLFKKNIQIEHNFIKWIDNCYFVFQNKESLIVYDIKKRREYQTIPGQYSYKKIDYNSQKDLLVASETNKISFFNRIKGQFQKNFEHVDKARTKFQEIQLLQNGNQILTSEINFLKLWQIMNGNLKIQHILDCQQFQFRSVQNDELIIIRSESKLLITDMLFQQKELGYVYIESDHGVLQSINYILLSQNNEVCYRLIKGIEIKNK